ncbi:MAG TPA: hydroxymyristoyl-ACP dehydratase [Legionellaceae bacterium]|nr:hydroxymyristoyl-ACP dehydratase [Legionellaceae bacterium]
MRFLFVDRILDLSSSVGSVRGIKHVTHEDFYLSADEEGRLRFMPALIGETLGQLTAWAVMSHHHFCLRPVAGIVASAQLYRSAYVGETIVLESWIDALDDKAVEYHGEARVGSELVFRLEGALGPLLPMEDFIDPILVRRQFAEINRPGEWPLLQTPHLFCNSEDKTPYALHFDHITHHEPGIRIEATKLVTRAAPYFPDHFPYKPVLPLTVLLECKMNLAKTFLAHAGLECDYQIHALRRIKMSDFVYPGDEVHCTVTVKHHSKEELILQYRSEVAHKRICVLEILLCAQPTGEAHE